MARVFRSLKLQVVPSDYWQVNTDKVGAAMAAITKGEPGLAILGLPLMNGYFTVFDGEADNGRGVVKFADAHEPGLPNPQINRTAILMALAWRWARTARCTSESLDILICTYVLYLP